MIANGGERMGCEVVEEHVAGSTSFFGRGSLLVGDFVESGDDCGITAAGIIKELATNLLDPVCTFLVQGWQGGGGNELGFLTVDGDSPEMRGILRLRGSRVLESAECLGDITRHGEVDIAVVVVPVKLETKVLGAGPILGEIIFGGEGGEEMISICFAEIFYAEVIDSQSESGTSSAMTPNAWGVVDRVVSERSKVGNQLVIG